MVNKNRRNFLKMVGLGSGAVAAAALPMSGLLKRTTTDSFSFRGTVGLPGGPFPDYATYVVEGHLDLAARKGTITKTLYAGGPSDPAKVALPGTSRVVKVTSVTQEGQTTRVLGVIEDRSTLTKGESAKVELTIDRSAGVARAQFMGSWVTLELADR